MRGARLLAAALAVLAGSSWAKTGTPGPHYFEGVYDRVGRSGGQEPVLLNDRVTITPVGQSVAIRACTGPETLMDFGPAFEIEYLMTGSSGSVGGRMPVPQQRLQSPDPDLPGRGRRKLYPVACLGGSV